MIVNRIDTLEQIKDFFRDGNSYLFGAGMVSKQILLYLSRLNLQVNGVAVSDIHENPKSLLGIKVISYAKLSEGAKVLLAVREVLQEEIYALLEKHRNLDIYCVSDSIIDKVLYANADYSVDIYNELQITQKTLNNYNKTMKRPCLEYMIVHILDHCNLRCKGCDHFACIADEHYVPLENIKRDVNRMSEIFGGDFITKIAVMGGEPLLHPDIKEILSTVRDEFPYAIIRLSTNGLLLLKQPEDFWEHLKKEKISIVVTKYPINLDYEAIKSKAAEYKIDFRYFEGTDEESPRRSFKKTINLKGDSDPCKSFLNCHIANYGNILLDGKFYGCPFSILSHRIFSKKFNHELRITEDDYIDIFKVNEKNVFFEFAARPKYYCRYCNSISNTFPWERSKQNENEWLDI